jgi:uncharacterized membrane protein YdjX (TVP38/TMEM64 family)
MDRHPTSTPKKDPMQLPINASDKPPAPAALMPARKLALWLALALALLLLAWWLQPQMPSAAWLQDQRGQVLAWQASQPLLFALAFFALFTLLSALALPGCGLLGLAAGLCFGLVAGTAIVTVASSVGATLSFWAARYWWRDAARARFGERLAGVEAGLAKDGAFYLFTLRLAPVIPYALINPLMGLSAMPTWQFFWVSLLGMVAGSAAYVYAGTLLTQAHGWQDVFTVPVLLGLAALAVLPWLARWLCKALR